MKYLSDILSALALLGLVGLIAVMLSNTSQSQFFGQAKVLDGDSIVMSGKRMRLEGIDAPEFRQTCKRAGQIYDCGKEARNRLRQIIENKQIECIGGVTDKYERVLVRCFVEDEEINEIMVREGWAVSFGGYGRAEGQAQRNKVGLWAGEFERPQLWRQMRRELLAEQAVAPNAVWWKFW